MSERWTRLLGRIPPAHDDPSLALEHENGRDLSRYGSSKLRVGTDYDCPPISRTST